MKITRPIEAWPATLVAACCFASVACADISFTPRAALYFDNVVQRQSALDPSKDPAQLQSFAALNAQVAQLNALGAPVGFPPVTFSADAEVSYRSNPVKFAQLGGTLTFSLANREATQIAMTALYGKSHAQASQSNTEFYTYRAFNTATLDTQTYTYRAKGDLSRLDLELTLQHRINETFSFIGGLRAERSTQDYTFDGVSVLTTNFYNLYAFNVNQLYLARFGVAPAPFPLPSQVGLAQFRQQRTTWLYSARAGAAAFAPVGEKHLFYVNGLLHVSYQPTSTVNGKGAAGNVFSYPFFSETSIGPDISVGYMYRISDRFGADLRYRATVYFPVSGPSDTNDARVNHGVSLGFTTWFGDR